jgi:hypothetical protein
MVRVVRSHGTPMTMRRVAPWTLAAMVLAPALADAREPLPYVEIVQPKKPRLRLLDVRWGLQVGGGFALGKRTPVLSLAQTGHISMLELSRAMQMHVALATTGVFDPTVPRARRRGMFGADFGLGLSRHVSGGPLLAATFTTGPRWRMEQPRDPEVIDASQWRVDGWGIQGQIDAYPFYRSIPELAKDRERGRGWRSFASGLHLWAAGRYDVMRDGSRAPTYLAGAGLDLGRTILVPILQAKLNPR